VQIGLDIGPVSRRRSGVGNYCFHLLEALLRIAPEHNYKGFAAGIRRLDLEPFWGRVSFVRLPVPTRMLYRIWSALGAPAVDTLSGGLDLFHATNFFLPPTRSARRILTIHDLAFVVEPAWCSPRVVGPFTRGVRRFAADADHVIADSEATRRDIIALLEVPPEKVSAIPLACASEFRPLPRTKAADVIRTRYARYRLSTPYVLFVGTLEPRKNLVGLVLGFAKVASQIPHRLVLAGPLGWNTDELFATIDGLGLSNRIVRPGYIAEADLPALYAAADVFVLPSHYEGFGLPVLEAMACGCPVVVADNSSLPEVAGNAAIYCRAGEPETIGSAILEVLTNDARRSDLIQHGLTQAAKFSWDSTARATLDAYWSALR
jgi:glycosyltransferase involved in cell wall biosynthesis